MQEKVWGTVKDKCLMRPSSKVDGKGQRKAKWRAQYSAEDATIAEGKGQRRATYCIV